MFRIGVDTMLLLLFLIYHCSTINLNSAEALSSLNEEFNLEEESGQGTIVGTINTSKLVDIPSNVRLSFNLYTPTATTKSYFQIEKSTGKIILQRRVDREQKNFHDIFTFEVRITINDDDDKKNIDNIDMYWQVTITVHIIDINDFTPSFEHAKYTINILESSKVHQTLFTLPQATDKDSALFNIESYDIVCEDKTKTYFKLDISNDTSDGQPIIKPYLRQIQPLDRETTPRLNFKLQATDKGGKLGETKIEIIVTDQNDNYPQFIGLPYRINVSECSKPGQEIFRLRAEDKDLGKFQTIEFKISELAPESISTKFHISSWNRLVLSKSLDYEEDNHKLRIPIVAEDGGGLSNTTDVEVWIEDCNDNVASITIYLAPKFNRGSYTKLIENDSRRRQIAAIVTRDADSGQNGDVDCHLSDMEGYSGNFELALDKVEVERGFVQVKRFNLYKREAVTFDREVKSRYELKITCSDHGNQRLENSKSIIIDVEDENDCRPTFKGNTNFFIAENNLPDAYIDKVYAEDKDNGKNSLIKYKIWESEYEKYFSINDQGRISAKIRFDREDRDFYNFTVVATDSGESRQLSGNTTVTVRITDVNDCEPEYHGQRNFFIDESNGTRHVSYNLGKLNATDRDLLENSALHFSLSSHYGVEPRQMRDCYRLSDDGMLWVSGLLDREKYSIHKLNITISDRSYIKPLKSHVLITVTLRDVNDNRPKIISDSMIKTITPKMTRGTELLKLRAEDPDLGENKSVTFHLAKSSLSDYFTLSPDGILMLAKQYVPKQLGRHLQNYNIQVIAKDGGNLTSRAYLRGTFELIRPMYNGDGRNGAGHGNRGARANDNFAELNQENNLLILLCVAASVVLIFVVVVIVFGYTYLKGDTICFPRRNNATRYANSYDSATVKLPPRHIGNEENNSDKACFNSLLPAGKMTCPISNCNEQDCDHMTHSGDYSTKSATLNCQYYKELCHTLDEKLTGCNNKDNHLIKPPSHHSTFSTSLSKSKSQSSDISSNKSTTLDRMQHTINNRSILKTIDDGGYRSNDYGDRYRGLRFMHADNGGSRIVMDTTHIYTELENSRLNNSNVECDVKSTSINNQLSASMARQPKITSSFV